MNCTECSGSGACAACDGYGCLPPPIDLTHGEGPECDMCFGDGLCVACYGNNHSDKETTT